MSYSLIIADDHQLVLQGISSMIEEMDEFEILATSNDGKDAVEKFRLLEPQLVVLDIEMPKMNGLEAARLIKGESPNPKVVFLSMFLQRSIVKKVMDMGVDGYIIKNADKDEFQLGLRKIMSGKKYFSSEITEILTSDDSSTTVTSSEVSRSEKLSQLTERERDILKHLAEGMSNKEIGEVLFISHRTVDTHRTNLMKKLDLHSIAELIRFAYQVGLVEH